MVMRFPKQNDDVQVTDIVESYDHYEVPLRVKIPGSGDDDDDGGDIKSKDEGKGEDKDKGESKSAMIFSRILSYIIVLSYILVYHRILSYVVHSPRGVVRPSRGGDPLEFQFGRASQKYRST